MRILILIYCLLFISCGTYKKYKYYGPTDCSGGAVLDTDGDGVRDIWDKCPNTLGGVAVTTHGCPWDTDGDGVPDYIDHQLITPTECQPVDSLGVGMCPCPCEENNTKICDFKFKPEWVGFSHLSYIIDSIGKKIN